MRVDHEELMKWAKLVVWAWTERPVRLEIRAEDQWIDKTGVRYLTPIDRIVARVYLREPRCVLSGWYKHDNQPCECGPIAERRLA
jgi:hypothetical protein